MAALRTSWRSFSLRTLLIAVTVCCCFLGYEVNVVRQRKAKLREFQTRYYIEVTMAADYLARHSGISPPSDLAGVSTLRRWLGDEAIQRVGYNPGVVDQAKLSAMRRWFPEASFVAERPMEPCHPGCFPWGTKIETAKGLREVEQIQVGDKIVAILRTGEVTKIPVSSIFRTHNRLLEIHTTEGTLLTTPQQPLCMTSSKNVAAGQLEQGDLILVWRDGKTRQAKVRQVVTTDRIEPVINLVLRDSEAYIANGFVARSKPPADLGGGEHRQSLPAHQH